MNDTELKALTGQVKKPAARVEALERLFTENYSAEAGLRKTARDSPKEHEAF
jgi:hypothetical protein